LLKSVAQDVAQSRTDGAHVIKEDRALPCSLEKASTLDRGTVPPDPVAKQLTLEERARIRTGADNDERAVGAPTVKVHVARQKLLAGPGFASNQQRGIGIRRRERGPRRGLEARVLADERKRAGRGNAA
jgi:hypothetical protein